MANTHIEGRVVRISRPCDFLYHIFTDLSNFTKNLPPDIASKADISSTPDTLIAKVQGFEIGMKVSERTPFSTIRYSSLETSPLPFSFTIKLDNIAPGVTDFQLIMDSELSGMLKMMVGGKLQEVVDKVTDQIESAMNM